MPILARGERGRRGKGEMHHCTASALSSTGRIDFIIEMAWGGGCRLRALLFWKINEFLKRNEVRAGIWNLGKCRCPWKELGICEGLVVGGGGG